MHVLMHYIKYSEYYTILCTKLYMFFVFLTEMYLRSGILCSYSKVIYTILETLAKTETFSASIKELKKRVAESELYKNLTKGLDNVSQEKILETYLLGSLEPLEKDGLIAMNGGTYKLTRKGKQELVGNEAKNKYLLALSPEEAKGVKKLLSVRITSQTDSYRKESLFRHNYVTDFFDKLLTKERISESDITGIPRSSQDRLKEILEKLKDNHIVYKQPQESGEDELDRILRRSYPIISLKESEEETLPEKDEQSLAEQYFDELVENLYRIKALYPTSLEGTQKKKKEKDKDTRITNSKYVIASGVGDSVQSEQRDRCVFNSNCRKQTKATVTGIDALFSDDGGKGKREGFKIYSD